MTEPISDTRLAEIRKRANATVDGWPLYVTAPTIGAVDCRALLAEVDRLTQQLATLKTEWGVEWGTPRRVYPFDTELDARTAADSSHPAVSRLVGPWRPADGSGT